MPLGPDPLDPHPMAGFPQITYLRAVLDHPQIEVGEYTYYDDPDGHEAFLRQVMYLFPFVGDRLVIGRFCALARGVRFIMNGANHAMGGFSTYPFFIFGHGWAGSRPADDAFPHKGDTVVGHDVWIGWDALVMPGVQIGSGAIVAARSVVTQDVPPYAIVAGNPAKVVRRRFDDETIAALLDLAWWDWPAEAISAHLTAIQAAGLDALRAARPSGPR